MTSSRPGAAIAFPCPNCGNRMGVYYSQGHRLGYFRRFRKCKQCKWSVTTVEIPVVEYTRLIHAASETRRSG